VPRQEVSKKIAYALVCYDTKHSGVFKKIRDQVTVWKSLGYIVQLYVITDEKSQDQWQEIDANCVVLIDRSATSKIVNRIKLVSLAAQSSASLVYIRDNFPLRIPRLGIPIVIEVQSLVGQELRMRSKPRHITFLLLKKFLYRSLAGAIFVTRELMEINEFKLPRKTPRIAIGNAIDLKRFSVLPPRPNTKPSLFFVGSPNQPWHGVNELVEFAKLNPDIQVEVVGVLEERPIPNVNFHGLLSPDEYQVVATRCVAGVGSLKLSMNKMTEASPLKVREYLALGLPVILKYKDVDLESTEEYVLQLPNDHRQLSDFSFEIRSFLHHWSSKRVLPSQITNIDVSAKEEIRLGFFEKIVSQHAKENPGGLR
jgi:glycosyltransferase involved in cell wall biosynthesis